MSAELDVHRVRRALACGARGFMAKTQRDAKELALIIRAVSAGERWIESSIAAEVTAPSSEPPPALTRREFEIHKLASEGLSDSLIADKLAISCHTVRSHRNRICKKLEVTRLELVASKGSRPARPPKP